MSTTTRDGRTGYGNKAYRRALSLDIQHISGWILVLIGIFAVVFCASHSRARTTLPQAGMPS